MAKIYLTRSISGSNSCGIPIIHATLIWSPQVGGSTSPKFKNLTWAVLSPSCLKAPTPPPSFTLVHVDRHHLWGSFSFASTGHGDVQVFGSRNDVGVLMDLKMFQALVSDSLGPSNKPTNYCRMLPRKGESLPTKYLFKWSSKGPQRTFTHLK